MFGRFAAAFGNSELWHATGLPWPVSQKRAERVSENKGTYECKTVHRFSMQHSVLHAGTESVPGQK